MENYKKSVQTAPKSHSDCSGCGLCMLVCPMWRRNRDLQHSPHGCAKALQHGAAPDDLAEALWNCTLCRACDPVCPEQLDISGMILKLRGQLAHPQTTVLQGRMVAQTKRPASACQEKTALLAGEALRAHPALLKRITALLGESGVLAVAHDDGADISLALEAGLAIPPARLAAMIEPLRRADKVIVADGLLLPYLAQWLPAAQIFSLGETLSSLESIRRNLRSTDLYVIEPRAYHADYVRLVKHYDRLRKECGCDFNLDLQRIAIPATVRSLPQRLGLVASNDEDQTRWVLHGRRITRIVVESLEDRAAFEKVCAISVVHLAELADDL
ncbi:MAG: 4Fe-4S dicluster domain-containing protein [Gallionella sp.]|nr:4Fe-4S dicluster domain-containing protein [Gallionella sp.]